MSQAFSRLPGKIRDADAVTAELLTEVIREICSRLRSVQRTKDFQRLEQYIQSGAWTDAVLALPPAHGFDTAAYVVPIVAVVVLLFWVALRRRPPSPPGPGGSSS